MKILEFGMIAFGIAAVMGITVIAVSRDEQSECMEWQSQAKSYPGYYITQWQYDQCQAHGISIDAPVK